MKIRYAIGLILAMGLAGCSLNDVKDRGDSCPQDRKSEDVLSYIMTVDEEKCTEEDCPEFAESFSTRTCPNRLPSCHVDTAGEYYCMTACSASQAACDGICVDPNSDRDHCGARGDCYDPDEDSDNYAGKKCAKDQECDEGKCSERICSSPKIICDGECIDPMKKLEFCGAKGECNSIKPGSKNYQGKNCGKLAKCVDGECTCQSGAILCDEHCVDPVEDHDFCGARGECSDSDENSDDYRGVKCKENEECKNRKCISRECEGSQELCQGKDGESYCADLENDMDNCGMCAKKCTDMTPDRQTAVKCAERNCIFECSEGYTNCGTEDSLKCVSLDERENCGECGHQCGTGEKCENKVCVNDPDITGNTCPEDICNKDNSCQNTNSACGGGCTDCTILENSEGGECINGVCKISQCLTGFHLDSMNAGNKCVQNTNEECAPVNSSAVEDCTKKISGGKGVCGADGTCQFGQCDAGLCQQGTMCFNDDMHCGSSCENCSAKTAENKYWKCSASGVCESSGCRSGLCNLDGQCVNTDKNCGENCRNCSVSHGKGRCDNGTCLLDGCDSGYYESGGKCLPYDDSHCGSSGKSCSSNESCIQGVCRLTSCGDGDESNSCYLSNGTQGVCKTTGATGGTNIKCVDEETRDTECFIDGTPKSCKASGSGSTGTCIYNPSLASKYAGKSQRWICECSVSNRYFCLSKEAKKYKCTTYSDCKYVY